MDLRILVKRFEAPAGTQLAGTQLAGKNPKLRNFEK